MNTEVVCLWGRNLALFYATLECIWFQNGNFTCHPVQAGRPSNIVANPCGVLRNSACVADRNCCRHEDKAKSASRFRRFEFHADLQFLLKNANFPPLFSFGKRPHSLSFPYLAGGYVMRHVWGSRSRFAVPRRRVSSAAKSAAGIDAPRVTGPRWMGFTEYASIPATLARNPSPLGGTCGQRHPPVSHRAR